MNPRYARPNLDELSTLLGYPDEAAMLRGMYLEEYHSITQIAKTLGYSVSTIRLKLVRMGVNLRGKGGANNFSGRKRKEQQQ